MSFEEKAINMSLEQNNDQNIVPGAVLVTDETPRTSARRESLVSRNSVKRRSLAAEFSHGESTGRKSAARQEDPVLLHGTGSAIENQIPISLEREVILDLL
jgi:hypothetical protein